VTGVESKNGSVSVRTFLTIVLGVLQSLLVAAGWMLYDQLSDTNENIVKIRQNVADIRLDETQQISELKTRIGILEARKP
jgi:hypothetical protein